MSIEDTNIQSDLSQEITSTSTESILQVQTEPKTIDIDNQLQTLQSELKIVQEQLAEVKKQDKVKQLQDELEKTKNELERMKVTQVQNAGDKQAQLKAVSPTSFNTGTKSQSQVKVSLTPQEKLKIIASLER